MLHHIRLVGLLADGGGRPGGHKFVVFCIQPRDDRPAVIDHAAVKQFFEFLVGFQVIALRLAGFLDESFHHPLVSCIAPGDHDAGQQHRLADFQIRGWFHH